jgi:hypothetical protein
MLSSVHGGFLYLTVFPDKWKIIEQAETYPDMAKVLAEDREYSLLKMHPRLQNLPSPGLDQLTLGKVQD